MLSSTDSSVTNLNGNGVERVRLRDDPKESLYVLVFGLSIVLVASALLFLQRQEKVSRSVLPAEIAHTVTQLSNARVEITLLQELDILLPEPSLAELKNQQLPPFIEREFIQLEAGCFLTDLPPFVVRFKFLPSVESDSPWEIAWFNARESASFENDHSDELKQLGLCAEHPDWSVVNMIGT